MVRAFSILLLAVVATTSLAQDADIHVFKLHVLHASVLGERRSGDNRQQEYREGTNHLFILRACQGGVDDLNI